MKIEAGTVVTMSYDLMNEAGEIIESSGISGPVTFLHGSSGMIPGLDRRITGLVASDERTFEFPPEEAFGRPEDGPTKQLGRTEFPAGAQIDKGMTFEAGAGGQTIKLQVIDVTTEHVTVRLIHPLAGQKMSMSVKIEAVRAATAAERESGKVQSAPPPPPKR